MRDWRVTPGENYQFHKGNFVGLKASLITLSSDYLQCITCTYPECNIVDENWSYISQKILEATDNSIPHKILRESITSPGSAPL